MRIAKQKHGQFIIIAALMIAIMMVSVSAIMYGAVTYFRHERWEEYLAIIDNVKLGSYRVVETSLANYTLTMNNDILRSNLDRWENDVKKAYAGYGIALTYTPASGLHFAYGVKIPYNLGLAYQWCYTESFSAANVTFTLNITSARLTGYRFTSPAFLKVRILDAIWYDSQELIVYLTVNREGLMPITGLKKDNFSILVDDEPKDFTLVHSYSGTYQSFVYEIHCNAPSRPYLVSTTAVDMQGIKVIANSTVTLGT